MARCYLTAVVVIRPNIIISSNNISSNVILSKNLLSNLFQSTWILSMHNLVLYDLYPNIFRPQFFGPQIFSPNRVSPKTFCLNTLVHASFCSHDFYQVIVFFFWKSNFKMALIWKMAIFDLLFTFFSHQGEVTKIPSAHISLTYIHVFCSSYWLFCLTNFEKKNTNLSGMVSLWYESWCWFLFTPFWNNQ